MKKIEQVCGKFMVILMIYWLSYMCLVDYFIYMYNGMVGMLGMFVEIFQDILK